MPVLVVGADSEVGEAVIGRLRSRAGEVRAFVSDPAAGARLRAAGVKTAIGDVSDLSHVGGASLGAFSAVLIASTATDGREISFGNPRSLVEGWIGALAAAGVTRIIVVGASPAAFPPGIEATTVPAEGRPVDEVAADVAERDDAARL
jgi:putative NADH-flavin reductase